MTLNNDLIRLINRFIRQIVDYKKIIHCFPGYIRYFSDLKKYKHLSLENTPRTFDLDPQINDLFAWSTFDSHYYYANGWAARKIVLNQPKLHVDIGSQIIFSNLLAAFTPTIFVDFRPLKAKVSGLTNIGADVLRLPFETLSINSLSCLHVLEHIGLGRYGDKLDSDGTIKAAMELERVVAPGGNLYIAIPVGKKRVCFNAHRIYTPDEVCSFFRDCELAEFSIIDDNNQYIQNDNLGKHKDDIYSCGLFWFHK